MPGEVSAGPAHEGVGDSAEPKTAVVAPDEAGAESDSDDDWFHDPKKNDPLKPKTLVRLALFVCVCMYVRAVVLSLKGWPRLILVMVSLKGDAMWRLLCCH
jgi:hypothetical protein